MWCLEDRNRMEWRGIFKFWFIYAFICSGKLKRNLVGVLTHICHLVQRKCMFCDLFSEQESVWSIYAVWFVVIMYPSLWKVLDLCSFLFSQFCGNYGTCLFKECMALCVAYDSGIALSEFSNKPSVLQLLYMAELCWCILSFPISVAEWFGTWMGTGFCIEKMCGGQTMFLSYLNCLIKYIAQHNQTLKSFMIYYIGLDWFVYLFMQPAHEKIGVVDSEWIVHQVIPSIGNQVGHHSQPKGKIP